MKSMQVFEADDGTKFASAEECKAYEANTALDKLTGLSIDEVRSAISYENKELARSIEAVARLCFAARSAAGDVSARGRKKAESPTETQIEAAPEEPAAETADNVEQLPTRAGKKKAA